MKKEGEMNELGEAKEGENREGNRGKEYLRERKREWMNKGKRPAK